MKEAGHTDSQEQKAGKILSEEEMRKAIQLLLDGEGRLDTDPFQGNLPKKMPDRFRKK